MPDVVGVVFHTGGKVYYFDPNDIDLARGEQVVVQTMRGTEIGQVVDPPHSVPDEDIPAPLKRVMRRAGEEDQATLVSQGALRREAMAACRELIGRHGLDMKLVDAEIVFGGGKIVFSFYSEERVDFRALVADLARTLKMRIELRQIGAREEARVVGGLGPCGRHLCCTLFQGDQEPVSIRMAKEQNLPLNPLKISGLCGRLMCCLKYEQDQYVCFRREAPNRGTQVQTELGPGVVVGFQVPKESLTVRLDDGSLVDVPIDTCSCGGAPCRQPTAAEMTASASETAGVAGGAAGAGVALGAEAAGEDAAPDADSSVEVAAAASPAGEELGGAAAGGGPAFPLGIVIVDDTVDEDGAEAAFDQPSRGNGGGAGSGPSDEVAAGYPSAGERLLDTVPAEDEADSVLGEEISGFEAAAEGDDVEGEAAEGEAAEGEGPEGGQPGRGRRRRSRGRRRRRGGGRPPGESPGSSSGPSD